MKIPKQIKKEILGFWDLFILAYQDNDIVELFGDEQFRVRIKDGAIIIFSQFQDFYVIIRICDGLASWRLVYPNINWFTGQTKIRVIDVKSELRKFL